MADIADGTPVTYIFDALSSEGSADLSVSRRSRSEPDAALRSSYAWLVVSAFGLYWLTHLILDGHNGASSFGADSTLYNPIAFGGIVEDRLMRFHPLTIHLAIAWAKILRPLSPWVPRQHLFAALFAAIGACGVRAALSAFERLVQRRYILLCGLIYASSLGVWYFSGIAESKILTATLTTSYIAIYLHLRESWRWDGVILLTGVLAAACLNEIVSAFLIIISVVDLTWRRRLDTRAVATLAAHGVVILLAFYIVEVIVPGFLAPSGANLESGSSSRMFWFYAQISDHSLSGLYGYLLNWLCFNIAAPTPHAFAAVPIWPNYFGYFAPSFAGYFGAPAPAGLVVLAAIMALSSLAPRAEAERPVSTGLLLSLLAFAALRGAFFFAFNPAEVMLFSSAVTLPVLVGLLAPFLGSRFPAKMPVLAAFAFLLVTNNLRFMLG